MAYYSVCLNCESHLDPGERCTCTDMYMYSGLDRKQEMINRQAETIRELEHITDMEDLEHARTYI
jgi:hypothetical protein